MKAMLTVEPPPRRNRWFEAPAFWPTDVACWVAERCRWRLGTYSLYQWTARFGFWVSERFNPTAQQTHQACPCTFTPGSTHFYMEDPDPGCDICWGSGGIWTDWQGNVIGNTEVA